MSSPKVLCVGHFTPDCHLRWMADGFAQAGCRVLRAGTVDYTDPVGYAPWPDEAKPRVHACPGFPERGLGMQEPPAGVLDLREVVRHFAAGLALPPPAPPDLRSDSFTADLVYADASGLRLTEVPRPLGGVPIVLRGADPEDPERVRVWDGREERESRRITPGVDLYTFYPPPWDLERVGHLEFEVWSTLPFPTQAKALRSFATFGIDASREELMLRLHACGVPGAEANSPDTVHLHTWRARAAEVLSRVLLEPGACPRL